MNLKGGYLIINKDDANIYAKLQDALTNGKPVLFYENDTTCYYIDTIALNGADIVLTKGGKTITIEADGDITESGNIQNHLYNYYADSVYLQTNDYGDIRGTWMFTAIEDNYDLAAATYEEVEAGLRKILEKCGIINIVNSDIDTEFTGSIYLDKNNRILIEGYSTSQNNYISVILSSLENDNNLYLEINWDKAKLF